MSPEIIAPGVYVQEVPSGLRPVTPAPTSVTAFIGEAHRGPLNAPTEIISLKGFERMFGRAGSMHAALHLYFVNGGQKALIVRSRNSDLKAFIQALHSLKENSYNLLCLPAGAGADQVSFAAQTCEQQRTFLLLDPPETWTDPQTALERVVKLGTQSANAAVYFPQLEGRGGGVMGPAAAVAGVIARTDAARGVWKAPAGLEANIIGILGLRTALSDTETAALTAAGINPLVSGSGSEPLVWGARTLAEAGSEWRYLPVRRTALFIENSIACSTGWAVFEPNDEPLWAQLRASVETFLMALFHQGAFQGNSAQEAFFVRCDASTVTASDIAAKRANLLVGFAPLKPAEFVILHLEIRTA